MAELVQSTPESSDLLLERRLTRRFPLRQEIRYQLVQSRCVAPLHVGRTLDVSSRGILFTTTEHLPVGHSLEIAMHWPAQLNGDCPLQFMASGQVLRSDGTTAVMRIQRYEFRTRSTASRASRSVGA